MTTWHKTTDSVGLSSVDEMRGSPWTLRIAFLGDAENTIVRRHATWFANRGHDVHVLHCPMQDHIFEGGMLPGRLQVHDGLRRPGQTRGRVKFDGLIALWCKLKSIDADVVHLLNPRPEAQVVAKFTQTPVVFTPWGADILSDPRRSSWLKIRAHLLLRKIGTTVAASDSMLQHARTFTQSRHEICIPWGVDMSLFDPGRNDSSLRAKLGIPEEAKIIASPRQLGEKYNHEIILRSFQRVCQEREDVFLVMKYAIIQGRLHERIESLLDELAIRHRVRVMGPSATPEISHQLTADLLCAADVMVSVPTWDGGSPATLFEALAAGALPILSDIDTNTEYVSDGVDGLIVPIGDAHALAKAILNAVANDSFRTDATKNNRMRMWDTAELQLVMSQLEYVYHDVAAPRKNQVKDCGTRSIVPTLVHS